MRRLRGKLTYANVVSTILLAGMLAGGGAYAATKIGPNGIRKNAVRSKHVKNGGIKAIDLDPTGLPIATAWAEITPGGGVRASFGMSEGAVTHPTNPYPAGIYCINVPAQNASVSPGHAADGIGFPQAILLSRASLTDEGISPDVYGCATETPWVVITVAASSLKNTYFQILLH